MERISTDLEQEAPEWPNRLLKVSPDVTTITGRSRTSVYRDIEKGILPPLIHLDGSSRMPGWELWARFKCLVKSEVT